MVGWWLVVGWLVGGGGGWGYGVGAYPEESGSDPPGALSILVIVPNLRSFEMCRGRMQYCLPGWVLATRPQLFFKALC